MVTTSREAAACVAGARDESQAPTSTTRSVQRAVSHHCIRDLSEHRDWQIDLAACLRAELEGSDCHETRLVPDEVTVTAVAPKHADLIADRIEQVNQFDIGFPESGDSRHRGCGECVSKPVFRHPVRMVSSALDVPARSVQYEQASALPL